MQKSNGGITKCAIKKKEEGLLGVSGFEELMSSMGLEEEGGEEDF